MVVSLNSRLESNKEEEKTRSRIGFGINGGGSRVRPKRRTVLSFQFSVLGFGFWVLGFGFWVLGFGFWVLGFWVRSLGIGI